MRAVSIICLALLGFSAVYGLPKDSKNRDEIETASSGSDPFGYGQHSSIGDDDDSFPFAKFSSVGEVLNQMRAFINSWFNQNPFGSESSEIDVPERAGFPIPSIDLNAGNSTSITKIIDGHKVVINETKYQKGDANNDLSFQIQTVVIKPISGEGSSAEDINTNTKKKPPTEVTAAGTKKEIFTENNDKKGSSEVPVHIDNEITRTQLNEVQNRFGFFDVDQHWNGVPELLPHIDDGNDMSDAMQNLDFENKLYAPNYFNLYEEMPPIDLSHDIYVNELEKKSGATTNPDAEIIGFIPISSSEYDDVNQNGPIRKK